MKYKGMKMKKNLFIGFVLILLIFIVAGCSDKPSSSYDLGAPSWFTNTIWENDAGERLRITDTDIFMPDGPEEGLITALKAYGGSMTTTANASRYEIHVNATRTEFGARVTIDMSYIFEIDSTGETLTYREEGTTTYTRLEDGTTTVYEEDGTPVSYKKVTITPPSEGLLDLPSWLAGKTWTSTEQEPLITIASNNDLIISDKDVISEAETISAQVAMDDEWKQGNDNGSYWISYTISYPGEGWTDLKMTFTPLNNSSFRLTLEAKTYYIDGTDTGPAYHDETIFILN